MKNWLIWVGILIIAVGISIYYFKANPEKTFAYNSKTIKYSFKYPTDWKAEVIRDYAGFKVCNTKASPEDCIYGDINGCHIFRSSAERQGGDPNFLCKDLGNDSWSIRSYSTSSTMEGVLNRIAETWKVEE